MYALAQGISVPAEHVQGPPDFHTPITGGEGEDAPRWLRIEHSRLPQIDPFAQVFYNGYWFYVDKSDWSSKRTFALLTYMFSLQSTVQGSGRTFAHGPHRQMRSDGKDRKRFLSLSSPV